MQLMVHELGGKVEQAPAGEFGRTELTVRDGGGTLLDGPAGRAAVLDEPPRHRLRAAARLHRAGLQPRVARSPPARTPSAGLYGIQFHPEVVHTPYGTEILTRFLRDIAGCEEKWSPASVIDEQVEAIRAQVGEARAICGLSGGVDSATAALLVHRAIGDRLTCVFVDHGMMRKDEADAGGRGLPRPARRPAGPRRRRRPLPRPARRASTTPRRSARSSARSSSASSRRRPAKIEDARFLVQGTLYSDVIESGGDGRAAATIKSHHNVGGLPEDMEMELVEPLRMLFKDEVRAVAAELGLPERFVWRQPFPGPGLAIRIVGGEVTRERLDILRDADAILQEEIRAAGLYRELWQSFCVLPVVRSVGVQGDERSYAYPIVIRAVTSDDAMTADWARLPYDLLERASNRIINEVRGVNRVTLDITSKPPGHDRVGVAEAPVPGATSFPWAKEARPKPEAICEESQLMQASEAFREAGIEPVPSEGDFRLKCDECGSMQRL